MSAVRCFAIVAALLLNGCWFGRNFYSAADARQAIAPGSYRAILDFPNEQDDLVEVSMLPDGSTRLDKPHEPEDSQTARFVPLDAGGRHFVVWALPRHPNPLLGDATVYGLLARGYGGKWHLYVPFCHETARVARAAGARVHGGELDECGFPDRESLEAAFRRLVPTLRRQRALLTLVPVR